ncbi:MAG: HlyD family efflux transporter periplasmic adaptor subunit [Bacteroidia bacterium]|nr:HlyD family efflux transporter periplasmic adaptor subunit [Bacteroidia bacterium]
MTEEKDDIEIRSEEVQEILGHIPLWIIRWGITLIFSVIAVLLAGSWFFKYPEIINSPIVITTENPPVTLVAKVNGKLQELFVTDRQVVKNGECIAILENTSNYKDVFDLKNKLDLFRAVITKIQRTLTQTEALKYIDSTAGTKFPENYNLGELQPLYGSFIKSYTDYTQFLRADYHHKKIRSINDQVNKYNALCDRLIKQESLLTEELGIEKQQFFRDSGLYAKGVSAKADFDRSKSALLQKKFSYEGAKTTLSNTQIQITQLQQSVIDMEQQCEEQNKQLKTALNQSYDNLVSQINTWEQKYVLRSPIEGKVTFTKYWVINQNIQAGDKAVTIIPDKPSRTLGKLELPIRGSGKVKAGQLVNIKLDNYPYMEYGMLYGKIESISLVATDNNYSVEVSLPNGLIGNYGKKLEYSREMKGTAEIITEDIRLIERFINPLRALLTKYH